MTSTACFNSSDTFLGWQVAMAKARKIKTVLELMVDSNVADHWMLRLFMWVDYIRKFINGVTGKRTIETLGFWIKRIEIVY